MGILSKDPAPRPAKKQRLPSARESSVGGSHNHGRLSSQFGVTSVAESGIPTIPSALVEDIVSRVTAAATKNIETLLSRVISDQSAVK